MKDDPNENLRRTSRSWTDPAFDEALLTPGAPALQELADRSFGEVITDRRTSWVRRGRIGSFDLYAKTYDYPTMRDRSRGIGRNTAFARSRARRERDALLWLRAHDFEAPRPLGLVEVRGRLLLRRALLVTEAWPGRDVEALWPELDDAERAGLRTAIDAFVSRLHAAGFRDRNLDPRNLLAHPQGRDDFVVTKIDSPRFCIVARGVRARRLAAMDRDRLARGLTALDRHRS